jgi:hypothetical protein
MTFHAREQWMGKAIRNFRSLRFDARLVLLDQLDAVLVLALAVAASAWAAAGGLAPTFSGDRI